MSQFLDVDAINAINEIKVVSPLLSVTPLKMNSFITLNNLLSALPSEQDCI